MLNKVAGGLLVLAVLSYAAGVVTGNAYVYVMCFVILASAILFGLLVLIMNIIWKLLSKDFKKTYEIKRSRFNAVIFSCVLLFLLVSGFIDEVCLPEASGFISFLGYMVTFVFAVFLGWRLIRPGGKTATVAGSIVFVLSVGSLWLASTISLKSGEAAQVNINEQLKSLPYVDWVPVGEDIEKLGVTRYDPELAFDGINLYCSQILPEAYLMDMHGNIVHKWSRRIKGGDVWMHVEMCKNGDLLALVKRQMLVRLDWDSNIKLKKKICVHHDVCVDENKEIHILLTEHNVMFWHCIPIPVLDDAIGVLSPDGELKRKIYFHDLISEQIPLQRIVNMHRGLLRIFKPKNIMRILMLRFSECEQEMEEYLEPLHTNNIEIIDRDIEGLCKKGDWLLSFRELDLIGVVDAKTEKLIWSWGPGELDRPHHPTLLEDGNLLIFDNGKARGFSRIVELNPLTRRIVWEYKSNPPEKFFSAYRGSNQRLPNGNTLITETDQGRVFEVTKEGKIVWEFYNPDVKKEAKKRAAVYRMMRITDPKRYPHIRKLK